MAKIIDFELRFFGEEADESAIDFFDAAEALTGFQRSLALTTHLVLNGEIITQAPALKGAKIYALPPADGSWKFMAAIVTTGTVIYHLGTAPKDTPIGHLVRSAYDYAVSQSLGIHVDYEKSLGQSYEEASKSRQRPSAPTQSQMDSLIEKVEPNIRQMHRPIVASGTASSAQIGADVGQGSQPLTPTLDRRTYDFVAYTERSDRGTAVSGRVTSYNINTFKGRIYSFEERRPVPFILAEEARTMLNVRLLTGSLNANAISRASGEGDLVCEALIDRSRTGIVKRFVILSVAPLR